MCLIDHSFQLGVGELEQIVAAHDLDQVGAAAHLVAHGAAHLIGARSLTAAPVGMAARLYDGLTGDIEARTGEDALLHRLLGREVGLVHAQVAEGGDTGAQRNEHVGGAFVGADFDAVVERLVGQIVDPVPGKVGMVLEQAGQDVYRLFPRLACGCSQVLGAADGLDLSVLNLNEAIFDDLIADTCEDRSLEDAVFNWHVEQRLENFLKTPRGCLRHSCLLLLIFQVFVIR